MARAPRGKRLSRAGAALAPDEVRELRERCDRTLTGHGLRTPTDFLAELDVLGDDELAVDTYGTGGTVAVLENEVRTLLGKSAAVFMPSGTMIQQVALRIHAERRNRRVVAFHPTCHLELHEDRAYQRLHGLVGLTVGNPRELIALADLERIHEPLAALLIELPQREIGGLLPAWEDLLAQLGWARGRGAGLLRCLRPGRAAQGVQRAPRAPDACCARRAGRRRLPRVADHRGLGGGHRQRAAAGHDPQRGHCLSPSQRGAMRLDGRSTRPAGRRR
jgi:hypothetical protein